MANAKITKAAILTAIMDLVADDVVVETDLGSVAGADIISYCNTSLNQLEAKAAKAKERAAKNKAEGDALRAEVLSHITDEFQTADAITDAVEGFEDITKAKVIARLTQLAKAGEIVKEQIKVGDRKQMAYKLASADDEVEVTE